MEEGSVAITLNSVEVGFHNVQRSNQFDQFSELGQHECRVVVYVVYGAAI